MPPSYVKAYLKRSKNDANDAAAICEAVTRPSMRFVPTVHKTENITMRAPAICLAAALAIAFGTAASAAEWNRELRHREGSPRRGEWELALERQFPPERRKSKHERNLQLHYRIEGCPHGYERDAAFHRQQGDQQREIKNHEMRI